jgi:hypothetical protein
VTNETLDGGRTTGAVLIDGVVHKPASPWTPTVHALLRHLHDKGFDGAPKPLGFDDEGREMLSYLPGEVIGGRTPWPDWVFTDSMLTQVGAWLRRLHDATADFRPPENERWFSGRTMRPGLVVGHQDAAPFNAAVDDSWLVGFFVWDTSGPSTREFDLAFSALSWAALHVPQSDDEIGTDDQDARSRRLHLLLDSYGYEGDRPAFAGVVVHRARLQAGVIRQLAERGDPAAKALLPIAAGLERAATVAEALPASFWQRP